MDALLRNTVVPHKDSPIHSHLLNNNACMRVYVYAPSPALGRAMYTSARLHACPDLLCLVTQVQCTLALTRLAVLLNCVLNCGTDPAGL